MRSGCWTAAADTYRPPLGPQCVKNSNNASRPTGLTHRLFTEWPAPGTITSRPCVACSSSMPRPPASTGPGRPPPAEPAPGEADHVDGTAKGAAGGQCRQVDQTFADDVGQVPSRIGRAPLLPTGGAEHSGRCLHPSQGRWQSRALAPARSSGTRRTEQVKFRALGPRCRSESAVGRRPYQCRRTSSPVSGREAPAESSRLDGRSVAAIDRRWMLL